MREFEGRVAVVTGAASGIGFAIAQRLAEEGMRIVLADIEPRALTDATAAIEDLGVDALGVVTDVTEATDVDKLAKAATERFGKVHILVNNAGVGTKGRPWELSLSDWQWVVGVCFWGVVHGIRSFVPGMIAHGEEGHIVNTASMMGLGCAPGGGPYQAAKHAVTAVSESLSFDLQETAPQLKVTLLCPGYVDTRIRDASRNRPERFGGHGAAPVTASAAAAQPDSARPVPPETIADLAFDAISHDRFYAFADWDVWRPLVSARMEALLDRRDPVPLRLP